MPNEEATKQRMYLMYTDDITKLARKIYVAKLSVLDNHNRQDLAKQSYDAACKFMEAAFDVEDDMKKRIHALVDKCFDKLPEDKE